MAETPSEPYRIDEAENNEHSSTNQMDLPEQDYSNQSFYQNHNPMEAPQLIKSYPLAHGSHQFAYFQSNDFVPPSAGRTIYDEINSYERDHGRNHEHLFERHYDREIYSQRPSGVEEINVQSSSSSLRHFDKPIPLSQSYQPSSIESDELLEESNSSSPAGLSIGDSAHMPSQESSLMGTGNGMDVHSYPGITTILNADHNFTVPMVEATFVDPTKCNICGKKISRDMIRHMWTHQSEKRFKCVFPKESCQHKSGMFNRRYDFKKHLLNKHFRYDDVAAKKEHNLREKLSQWGTCPCGKKFLSGDWLSQHILTKNEHQRCPLLLRQNI